MRTKILAIRKMKYLLYSLGIHRVLPTKSLMFSGHLGGLSKWIHQHKDIGFTDFPVNTFDYSRRYDLYEYLIEAEGLNAAIDYLEFGVAKGTSFTWWTDRITNDNAKFYGFDTFTGLPEDWGPFKKGAMSNGNKPPEITGTRHQFYQGIFQDTLFNFLKTYQSDKRKVIHLDADLYSATLFVLTTLSPILKQGDILIFDEFNVPLHEYKAFQEWVDAFYINYTVLGQVNNYYQVALKLD